MVLTLRHTRYLLLMLAIAIACTGYWYFHEAGPATSAPDTGSRSVALVVAEPVQRRTVTDTIEALGTAQANESVTLTAKITDIVSSVNFEDGDDVEAGKILVVQASQEQTALLAEARANLDEANSQLRRLRDLSAKKLVPESQFETAKSQANAAQARLDSIIARLQDRLVRAPYSGVLGFRQISPGTLLTNNTPITTLDDISEIKLDFSVPELYLNALRPGFKILARSDAFPGREFNGELKTVGSRIDPVTRAVTVRALVPNTDRLLRPGMLLTVKIITAERQSLVVSESAVTQVGDETYVFIAGVDGLARKQPVVLGARRYDYVEVLEGLQEGAMVISEGGFKLHDGAPYRLQEQTPPAPGANPDPAGMLKPQTS